MTSTTYGAARAALAKPQTDVDAEPATTLQAGAVAALLAAAPLLTALVEGLF